MNHIAKTFAPLVASVAAAVACTAVSVALLGASPAQALGAAPVKTKFDLKSVALPRRSV